MRLLRGLALIGLMVTTAATAPVVTVPNVSVMEDAGSAAVNLLKPKSNSYSKVRLYTVDGTAKAGVDYHAVDVTLTLANSVLKVQQLIPILDNSTYQGDRCVMRGRQWMLWAPQRRPANGTSCFQCPIFEVFYGGYRAWWR
jgi:hypothetical protein